MLNPDNLVTAWVTALQGVPDLISALGSGANCILGYRDQFPQQSNLRRAILEQNPGSILVVYMGTDKARIGSGGAWAFRHNFSFIVRAPEVRDNGTSYAQIWALFVNGVPQGASLPLIHTEIDPACDAMDREGPTAMRNTLLVTVDGATLDYFEFKATLIEKAA